jgi:hypothetical protein
MGVVLLSVGAIDLVQYRRAGQRDRNVRLEATRGGAGVARDRGDAMPTAVAPVDSAQVDVIAGTDDPDGSRLARGPVAADRGNLDLLDCA